MALISKQLKRSLTPDARWLARGLKSAYLLRPGLWGINLVDMSVGGSIAGTGVDFAGEKLRTKNSTANYALLNHGIATNIALPVSFAVGCVRTSGSGVAWSLMSTATSSWTGWYSDGANFSVSNVNDFSGSVTIDEQYAVSHRGATELVAASPALSTDATATAPAVVANTQICLGLARRSVRDNAAAAEFTHFFSFQGALDDAELAELAVDPLRLFKPKPIWVPVSAASGPPTLAAIAASDLTASGARLTVT